MPTANFHAERAVGLALVEKLQHYVSPRQINSGGCVRFANEVTEHLNGEAWEILWIPGHTWIRVAGYHYDAEAPSGVENWRDLPFWQRTPPREGDEPEIKRSSNGHGEA